MKSKNQSQISRKALAKKRKNQSGNGRTVDERWDSPTRKVQVIPRNYGGAKHQNREAIENGITLDIPGVLAGWAFDLSGILCFLVKVLVDHRERIDAALLRKWEKTPVFQSENYKARRRVDEARSLVELRQVSLLAKEIYTNNPEIQNGPDFNSPFGGIARELSFSVIDLVELFCEVLHGHREIISGLLIKGHAESNVDLAEALVIAELVSHYLGFETELGKLAGGFLEPTTLQLQAWSIQADALKERLAA
jgi:hypothetical protein